MDGVILALKHIHYATGAHKGVSERVRGTCSPPAFMTTLGEPHTNLKLDMHRDETLRKRWEQISSLESLVRCFRHSGQQRELSSQP